MLEAQPLYQPRRRLCSLDPPEIKTHTTNKHTAHYSTLHDSRLYTTLPTLITKT